MAHVITEPCKDCKYTDCVVECPVECFYQDGDMLDFVIANVTEPLVPGSLAELRVIGVM